MPHLSNKPLYMYFVYLFSVRCFSLLPEKTHLRAHVLSHRGGALSVRAAGRGGGVRHAGLLRVVAHAGPDTCDAVDGPCPQAQGRQHEAEFFHAAVSPLRPRI